MSPSGRMRPGRRSVTELKARLASMANERIDIPLDHRRQGDPHRQDAAVRDAVRSQARARRLASGRARSTSSMAIRASMDARKEWSAWPFEDRAAVLLKAAELLADLTLARHGQCGDDARAGQDGVPVGDRRRLRADRFLALQRRLRRRSSIASSRSTAPASGTSSSIARSRASSTPSRRSTSPRSAATCRRRRC